MTHAITRFGGINWLKFWKMIQVLKQVTAHPKPSKHNTYVFITFIQCQPNVFDVGPLLYKCYTNVLCLLGKANLAFFTLVCFLDPPFMYFTVNLPICGLLSHLKYQNYSNYSLFPNIFFVLKRWKRTRGTGSCFLALPWLIKYVILDRAMMKVMKEDDPQTPSLLFRICIFFRPWL